MVDLSFLGGAEKGNWCKGGLNELVLDNSKMEEKMKTIKVKIKN
jgi:hypothetical protein